MGILDLFIADADAESFTHKRHDPDQFVRLMPDNTNEFWIKYCNLVEKENSSKSIKLSEKVSGYAPIIVSLTIQYPASGSGDIEDKKLPYTDEFIPNFVSAVQTFLRNNIHLEEDDKALLCACWATEPYSKAHQDAATIRLQFPLYRMQKSDQVKHLRSHLIPHLQKAGLVDLLEVRGFRWENALDTDIYTFLPLYGSIDPASGELINQVSWYDTFGDSVDFSDISNLLPPNKHNDVEQKLFSLSAIEADSPRKEYFLPLILSINYQGGRIISLHLTESVTARDGNAQENGLTTEQKYAEELLPLISTSRYKTDIYRQTIGMCLYNVYKGEAPGSQSWIREIKKAYGEEPIDEVELAEDYQTFSYNNPYTEVTLGSYAREDSRPRYDRWHRERCDELLGLSVTPEFATLTAEAGIVPQRGAKRKQTTQGGVARAFYMCHWQDITYLDGKWYKFNGTYLSHIRDGPGAEVNDFREEYKNFLRAMLVSRDNTAGTERRDMANTIQQIGGVMAELDNSGYCKGIVSSLATIIGRKYRETKANHDLNVFATARKWVLESQIAPPGEPKPMLVRKGKIEDFCTKHSYVTYDESLTFDSVWVRRMLKDDKRQLGSSESVDYMGLSYGGGLRRRNGEKRGTQWVGPPGSGKTTKKEQYDIAAGTYSWTPPSTIINNERTRAGGATPELAGAADCCFEWIEEPEFTNRVNEGLYCAKTGGSKAMARGLHKDGDIIASTAKWSSISNSALPFSPKPQIKARNVIVPHTGIFVPKEGIPELGIVLPATKEERKRLRIYEKKTLSEKELRHLSTARLWWWVYNHQYVDFHDSIPLPKMVVKATEDYWNNYDYFTVFKRKNLVESAQCSLTLEILYQIFTEWLRIHYRDVIVPNRNMFMYSMEGVIKRSEGEIYKGYGLKNLLYDEFVASNIVRGKAGDIIPEKEVLRLYRSWMGDNFPRMSPHNRDIIRCYLQTYLTTKAGVNAYNAEKGGYVGWINANLVNRQEND